VSAPVPAAVSRGIDPRGQRFGAGLSAIVLGLATVLGLTVAPAALIVVPLVGIALGVSSARGTRYFVFGRPWPTVRRLLRLAPPRELEHEVPPRFAQAMGATFLGLATLAFLVGLTPLGWLLTIAVAGLQTLLAATGYCLGCKLYGLKWYVPALYDRVLGVQPAVERIPLVRIR
jgi:Domain of unknown function (DUF4395)